MNCHCGRHVVDDTFKGTSGNADLAVLTLLVAGAARKLDHVVSFKVTPDGLASHVNSWKTPATKCHRTLIQRFQHCASRRSAMWLQENMRSAVHVLSAAVVGLTCAHALGTLAGVKDEAVAQAEISRREPGKASTKLWSEWRAC